MKKVLKFILSFVSMIIIAMVAIPIVLSLVLQIGVVQNFAVDITTNFLSKKAETTISISRVDIEFFTKLVVEDLYVEDYTGDTLVYIKKLNVGIDGINFSTGAASLGEVKIDQGQCNLYKDSTGVMNIGRLLSHFKSANPSPSKADFKLNARAVSLNNFRFKLDNYNAPIKEHGINYKQLELKKFDLNARDLAILNDDISLQIESLSLAEKSGLTIEELSSPRCTVNRNGLKFEGLDILSQRTALHFKHAYLLYDGWSAYGNFVQKVLFDLEFKPSALSYRTIAFFSGLRNTIPTTIELSGKIQGTIPNLHGFFRNIKTQNTTLSTEFSIVGLPKIKSTQFKLTLENLNTSAKDIKKVYGEFTNKTLDGISPLLERNGRIVANGTFEGLLSDFLASASIHTDLGTMNASLNVTPKPGKGTGMIGKLISPGYNLGRALGTQNIGQIACDANVDIFFDGTNTTMVADAKIPSFEVAGYEYNNISIDGRFEGKTYQGEVTIDDQNCKFTTNGFFDLTNEIPSYNFAMDLKHANLFAMGINKRDSISVIAAQFTSDGSGSKLDNLNGKINIESLSYVNHVDSVNSGVMTILCENSDTLKSLKLTSTFADLEFRGTNSYSDIIRYLPQTFKKYIPSFPKIATLNTQINKVKAKVEEFKEGSYQIKVEVKRANNVASIFVPGLQLATGTIVDLDFDPQHDKIRVKLDSEFIGTDTQYLYRVSLASTNQADSIVFRLNVESCDFAGLYFPNVSLRGSARNNTIKAHLKFNNPTDGSMADLRTTTTIYRTPENLSQIKLSVDSSSFALDHGKWTISHTYAIIDSTGIDIHNFCLNNSEQRLFVDGRIGRKVTDVVNVELEKIDISPASVLVSSLGYRLAGNVNGSVRGIAVMGNRAFNADLGLDNLYLNNYLIGTATVKSHLDNDRKRVNFSIFRDNTATPIEGYYDLLNKRYNIDVRLPNFDMILIEPLLKGILEDTKGEADVRLNISGGKGTPTLAGTVDIKEYSLLVGYTRARYSTHGRVEVANSCFRVKNLPLTDNLEGSGSIVDAYLDTDYFKNMRFGVKIAFENLLALNTTSKDNDVFYGKAFANGTFEIKGTGRKTELNITGETALATDFNLPFTGVSSISEADFITFVDHNEDKDTKEGPRRFFGQSSVAKKYSSASEMDVVINLKVTPNAKAQITMVSNYMDNRLKMGNQIEARGEGNFNLHINPTQDLFSMTGQYNISKGKYIFDFATVFDKEIVISPMSSISWGGDPADPELNINAIYKAKASLAPLMNTVQAGNSATTNINCGLNVTGKMSAPKMAFTITAPMADPEKQNLLRNVLNTQEIVDAQFFALFLTGSFTPDMGAASVGSLGSSLATATGIEFLSNQISNMISSEDIAIRVGYRPKSEYTSDEVNFGVEKFLIPNKLSLEVGGNYNSRNNTTYGNISPLSGDAYLTWIINKSETLKLKGFTRVIDRLDETQGLQETGMGISFRQDYQTLAEFRQKWSIRRGVKREKKAAKIAADTTFVPLVDSTKVVSDEKVVP